MTEQADARACMVHITAPLNHTHFTDQTHPERTSTGHDVDSFLEHLQFDKGRAATRLPRTAPIWLSTPPSCATAVGETS